MSSYLSLRNISTILPFNDDTSSTYTENMSDIEIYDDIMVQSNIDYVNDEIISCNYTSPHFMEVKKEITIFQYFYNFCCFCFI